MDDGALTVIVGLVMLVGIAGVVVPVLPGTALILLAGVGWAAFVVEDGSARWAVVGVMAVLFAVGAVLKYALPGRRMKGSLPRSTLVLAAGLGLAGLFLLPPLGLLLGGALGVYVGELRRVGSGRAGRSTVAVLQAVGLGVLAELVAAVLMVATWLVGVVVT